MPSKRLLLTTKKQNEIDYFIHKNANKFLKEQLNLFIYHYLFDNEKQTDAIWKEEQISYVQNIKKTISKVIDYVTKFEDELKAMWLKPKFVRNSNYIITLDKLNDELQKEVLENVSKEQRKEWDKILNHKNNNERLKQNIAPLPDECLMSNGLLDEPNGKYKYLPLDTKYMREELKYKILNSFENLDDIVDGVLIKSDNFQALNTIMPKYKEQIDLIYIDPPFNTGSDFLYKDRFQDSTWLTLMENRLRLSKELLSDKGSFYLHLDHNANYMGRALLNSVFGKNNFQNEITWRRQIPRGKKVEATFLSFSADYIQIFADKNKSIWNIQKTIKKLSFKEADKKYMKDEKGYFRTSDPGSYSNKSLVSFFQVGRIYVSNDGEAFIENGILKTNKGTIRVKYYKDIIGDKVIEETVVDNIWNDIPGMGIVSHEYLNFNTQKPEKLLERVIKASSNPDSTVMDYFSGSGTTINVAYKLGRKFIGVEMGEHFNTIILPRIKKNLFGVKSSINKKLEKDKLKKGGIVKYYELESYEDTLKNVEYKQDKTNGIINFKACKKLLKTLSINYKMETALFDFKKLYPDVDIAETISLIYGKKIKRLYKDRVILSGDKEFKFNELSPYKHKKLLKLIYWGSIDEL